MYSEQNYRIGIDIGGTFTDLVAINEETGGIKVAKTLTTTDPSDGVISGLKMIINKDKIEPGQISTIVHGTTLVTNALIERKGAKVALMTTVGHRDSLEIGSEYRYDPHDLYLEKPEVLVPRHFRIGINERILADGQVKIPLDLDEIVECTDKLKESGVEAVAISFLHSYKNDAHERAAAKIIRKVAPEMYISLSSEVVPEIREYERTSTTIANVYVKPITEKYLKRLVQELQHLGFKGNFFIMLSNGGICSVETAYDFPIKILESGPAAGALAASMYGIRGGFPNLLSFDMGGTTAKSCIIENGTPLMVNEFEVARVYRFKRGSGLPIKAKVIEMIEIGAGGGSIAYIDKFGLMKVGPQSAGSNPGPVCYGLGGTEPTVTDADLILGYLDPEFFLGGEMKLDREAAFQAIEQKIAKPLGVDPVEAAWGIHHVVNENMANSARVHATEHGKDLSTKPLFAFGGAGPVHAYNVAKILGLKAIIYPFGAGATSALGLLCAPLAFDFVHSFYGRLDSINWDEANRLLGEMIEQGAGILTTAGLEEAKISVQRFCDLRFVGQGHELPVTLPEGRLGPERVDEIIGAFEEEYENLYHQKGPGMPLEALNWRVTVSGPRPDINLKGEIKDVNSDKALKGTRKVYFRDDESYRDTPVYDRYRLGPGVALQCPAVFEEVESTIVVGPEAKSVEIDPQNNLIVRWK